MIQIIPAIDLIEGKCVRLSQGDYDQKTVYHDDPVQVALSFQQAGIQHIHVVDLDGARSKHIVNTPVLQALKQQTGLSVDFGGGIKTHEDMKLAIQSGANQVTVGSVAAQKPELFLEWLQTYGPDRLILGADVRDKKIAINGWKEDSQLELISFLKPFIEAGVKYVLCTDISRDGMLTGPAIDLYQELQDAYPTARFLASGGVQGMDDIEALDAVGVYGVITGKAIYEGRITLEDIKNYIQKYG